MKYYYHADGIKHETLEKLISFIHENPTGEITMFLNSSGGDSGVSKIFTKILNDNKDRVTLIASAGVLSAGFYIFYNYKGERKMFNETKGMWHLAWQTLEMNHDWTPSSYQGECSKAEWEESRVENDSMAKSIMNKKELKRYNTGGEVYFTSKRMKQIFPNVEVI